MPGPATGVDASVGAGEATSAMIFSAEPAPSDDGFFFPDILKSVRIRKSFENINETRGLEERKTIKVIQVQFNKGCEVVPDKERSEISESDFLVIDRIEGRGERQV